MNDALRMQISAFVDGELPENENELLLRRLSQDAALRRQVAQYLEIGRLIRREPDVPGMSELRDRIAAALGEEPVQHAIEPEIPASRFTRPAIGVAVAASVAVMALFALRQVYAPDETANAAGEPVAITVPDSQTAIDLADDELLKQFYLHHDPRLVTWELEFDSEEVPAEDDQSRDDDEETQD
jgi:negative regulator of sigma E activity